MPDDETFEDATQSQCALMMNEARRVMERGYAIVYSGFNPNADKNDMPFGYFAGGFGAYIKQWNETHKHNYLTVNIARAVQPSFVASFRVPTTKRFAPLVVALDLVSVEINHRYRRDRGQAFTCMRMTDNYEYRMYDKASLKIALGILDMPQHREMLTKRGRR